MVFISIFLVPLKIVLSALLELNVEFPSTFAMTLTFVLDVWLCIVHVFVQSSVSRLEWACTGGVEFGNTDCSGNEYPRAILQHCDYE